MLTLLSRRYARQVRLVQPEQTAPQGMFMRINDCITRLGTDFRLGFFFIIDLSEA